MRVSKEDYKNQKQEEKKVLESKLDSFLSNALTNKDNMDKLTAHYRISGLYGYSMFNSFLIALQGGQIAQSFSRWQNLNRCVNKGEKSHISIFAPIIKKEKDSDNNTKEILIGFRLMPVFDVSQTNGEPLTYDHNSTDISTISYDDMKTKMEALCKIPVKEVASTSARGYATDDTLYISSLSNNTDKIKTLIHEVAHHILHHTNTQDKVSHATREVEAESVSHLVSSYLQLDYDLSEAYISNWKAGIHTARTKAIISTADKIIKHIAKAKV